MIKPEDIPALEQRAYEIRMHTLKAIADLGTGHVGGSMSIVELLAVLYFHHLRIDPNEPTLTDRDRFVMSKGHAGPALYAALALRGFFSLDRLSTLNRGGTDLPSHCDMNRTPGVDMTTGSLGQGISSAIGIALGLRLDHKKSDVYLLIGDGECNEGQIWEGAMAASHFGLSNLIACIDHNRLQIDGPVGAVMNIEDINAKWVAFGWFVQRVNGHDFAQLDHAIERAKAEDRRPSMIIMDTIKGKGVHFVENQVASHNMPLSTEQYEAVIAALRERARAGGRE